MPCGKHVHKSRDKAKAHLLHTKTRSRQSQIYFCPDCDGYHVGRPKPWQDSGHRKRVTLRLVGLDEDDFYEQTVNL